MVWLWVEGGEIWSRIGLKDKRAGLVLEEKDGSVLVAKTKLKTGEVNEMRTLGYDFGQIREASAKSPDAYRSSCGGELIGEDVLAICDLKKKLSPSENHPIHDSVLEKQSVEEEDEDGSFVNRV